MNKTTTYSFPKEKERLFASNTLSYPCNIDIEIDKLEKEVPMPCLCSYEPSDRSKKQIKLYAECIVKVVKELEAAGDPTECSIKDVHQLIDHLYDPELCKENKYTRILE